MTIPAVANVQHERNPAYELARILNLPIIGEGGPGLTAAVNRMVALPEAFSAGFSLLDKQAEAVATFLTRGGSLFGPIGVGHGKTGITLLCAALAAEKLEMRRTFLVVPNKLCPQLLQRDIPWWRRHVRMNVRFWPFYKQSPQKRMSMALVRQPGCYILPYSALSNRDTDLLIEELSPELWILDECHNVMHKGSSARADRFFRHLQASKAKVVALSGTITNRHVTDYWHIMRACLGEGNHPLPEAYDILQTWDAVLGSERNGDPYAHWQGEEVAEQLAPFASWARAYFPELDLPSGVEGVRRAYRLRLMTTPGVVATSDDEIGTSLTITVDNAREPNEQPCEALKKARKMVELMEAPDGMQLSHAMHKRLYHWMLSGGIYYEHPWPDDATPEQVEVAEKHKEIKNEYRKCLRDWLKDRRRPGLDTPYLVGQSMHVHGVSEVEDPLLYDLWQQEREARKLVEIEPLEVGVRLCESKARHVARLVRGRERPDRGMLVFYQHRELGKMLVDVLNEENEGSVVFCPAGAAADARIIDPALADKIVVASMDAHNEGKNLQYMGQAIFAQFPRTASVMQQVLGRLHRRGQAEDEVLFTIASGGDFDETTLWAYLLDATYQSTTTPQRQKLLAARWIGDVKEFPDTYLIERGLEVAGLSEHERRVLADRFKVEN